VLDDPEKGSEIIKYRWQSKKKWLNSLREAVEYINARLTSKPE